MYMYISQWFNFYMRVYGFMLYYTTVYTKAYTHIVTVNTYKDCCVLPYIFIPQKAAYSNQTLCLSGQ